MTVETGPRVLAEPAPGRVLVVAPHADDDVLGCGGTAALHARQGDEVFVLVVFDGALGLPPGLDRSVRRREALAGGARLGLGAYRFWELPEGHEPTPAELESGADRLAALVRNLAPRTVYAPWGRDEHVDHRTVSHAVRAALERCAFAGDAWGYEVWTPLAPALYVGVDAVWDAKSAALAEHASQLALRDLAKQMRELAEQRGAEASAICAGRAHGSPAAELADVRRAEAFSRLMPGSGVPRR